MGTSDYVPEYLRACLSAGVLFSMLKIEPRIDSLSDEPHDQTVSIGINY